jgi:hypothetical protein
LSMVGATAYQSPDRQNPTSLFYATDTLAAGPACLNAEDEASTVYFISCGGIY